MRTVARRYDTLETVALDIEGGRITSVVGRPSQAVSSKDAAVALPYVAPGFFDVQVNGYGGQEFNDLALSVEQVAQMSLAQDACGVTRYCPTLTTHGFELLSHAARTIDRACRTMPEVA